MAHTNWVNTRSFEYGMICIIGPHIEPHAPMGAEDNKNVSRLGKTSSVAHV